ncbi:hypothetical protein L195_g064029, partial [Trifolium pratense]
ELHSACDCWNALEGPTAKENRDAVKQRCCDERVSAF